MEFINHKSVEMIKAAAGSSYSIYFINCPKDLNAEKLSELFGISAKDVAEIANIEKTRELFQTCVTIASKEAALKMFEKYIKDNVWLEFAHS